MITTMEPRAAEIIAPVQPPVPNVNRPKNVLTPDTTKLAVQVLLQLRNGLAQALLYTEGTKQFERSSLSTFDALNALLEAIGSFKIGIAKSEALVNGERVDTPASLRAHLEYLDRALDAASVAGLKIEKGLESQEVAPFLQMLSRKKFPATEGSKVNAFLAEQGITHILIDELRYVALSEEQKVYSGDNPMPGTHAVAQKALSELVDATLASIDKVSDTNAQIQLRAELTDQLIEKSDLMLANVIATAAARMKTSCTDTQASMIAVPQRDGKLLNDALELGKVLIGRGLPENDEALMLVRKLLEKITAPYQSHAEDILAKTSAENSSVALLPVWLVKAHAALKGGSAEERVEGILRLSPNALLDEQMFAQIVDVLDELSVAAMDAEADKLAAHMAGALQAPTKRERIQAVERLGFLLERSLEQSSNAVRIVEDGLLNACTHETCDEVMKLLLSHLCKRCVHHYELGNFQRAAEYMDSIVSFEESSRLALKDEGANLARLAREQFAKSDFVLALSGDLLEPGERGQVALRMVKTLGPEVWSLLMQHIRTETDVSRAAKLTGQLKTLGPQAAQLFFTALGKESEGLIALRLLGLASELADDAALWAQIVPLLKHADAAVSNAALALVLKHEGEDSVQAICQVLSTESNPDLHKKWIGVLARLPHPSAQMMLLGELDDAISVSDPDEGLLTTILDELSAAGNAGIVQIVATLTGARNPAPPKSLILAALKSIAPFYTDPLAIEILERARKDKDPEISRLALVCLRGIVAHERQQQPAEQAAPVAAPVPLTHKSDPDIKPGTRKVRRGFEALEASQVDDIFHVGATIGSGKFPAAEVPPPPPPPPASLVQKKKQDVDEPFIGDLKPTLEGRVQDLGLPTTVRIVGSKDGLLKVFSVADPSIQGRIYIRGRKILDAVFGEKTGMAALHILDDLRGVNFAYYAASFGAEGKLDIEIDKVQSALRRFRDQADDAVFFE